MTTEVMPPVEAAQETDSVTIRWRFKDEVGRTVIDVQRTMAGVLSSLMAAGLYVVSDDLQTTDDPNPVLLLWTAIVDDLPEFARQAQVKSLTKQSPLELVTVITASFTSTIYIANALLDLHGKYLDQKKKKAEAEFEIQFFNHETELALLRHAMNTREGRFPREGEIRGVETNPRGIRDAAKQLTKESAATFEKTESIEILDLE